LKYKFFNQGDQSDDQLKFMQRNVPERRRQDNPEGRPEDFPERRPQNLPGGSPQNFPGGPPQGFPGGPPPSFPGGPPPSFPGGPSQGFPGGPPPSFPPGPPPNFQPTPPPSFPGGAPVQPPMQERQRSRTPSFVPQPPPFDFRGIRRCLYRYTFVWLINGNSFWFFPLYVVGQSIIGFRWRGNRWEYFTLNTRRILFFQCF